MRMVPIARAHAITTVTLIGFGRELVLGNR